MFQSLLNQTIGMANVFIPEVFFLKGFNCRIMT